MRRNMVRALLFGLGIVTVIYVAVNYAYVRTLRPRGRAEAARRSAPI